MRKKKIRKWARAERKKADRELDMFSDNVYVQHYLDGRIDILEDLLRKLK